MKERARVQTLGGKTKFPPVPGCDRTERQGGRYPANTSCPRRPSRNKRACLPRTGSALATRGLRGTGATIACTRPGPVLAYVECAIVHHCVAHIQRNQEHTSRRETELGSDNSRSQEGIEIVRLCPGCVAIPEAILRCPGQIEMPILPLFFDTIPELGATKIRDRCLYSSGSALGHSPSWSLFRHFWAGKFHRHAKTGCVCVCVCVCVCYRSPSPRRLPERAKPKRILYTKGGSRNGGRERDGILGGKTKFRTARGVTGRSGKETDTRRTRAACEGPPAKKGRASLVRTPLWLPVASAGPEPRSHALDRCPCMPT